MSKYDLDLDCQIPNIDISGEELNEIIQEADRIIAENTESREKTAQAYFKKGQCLQKLEEINPEYLRLPGRQQIGSKQQQEIIKEIIETALELSPDMPEALMQMGKIYAQMEEYPEAVDFYTRAIYLKPDYPAAFHNRANCYARMANAPPLRYAAPHMRLVWYSLISPGPGGIAARMTSCKENLYKATEDCAEAIRMRQDAVFYYTRGRIYFGLEEYDKAIADYSEAIRIGSDSFKKKTDLFVGRGLAYTMLNDYTKAIADFSEEIRLEPDDAYGLELRAQMYHHLGEYVKAIEDYTEIIRRAGIFPSEKGVITGLMGRARAYFKAGEYDKAILDYTDIIRHGEISGESWRVDMNLCARGYAYWRKGETDKAVRDFTEAIRLNPDFPDSYGCRGELYRLAGEHEKAEADMAEFRRLKPKDAEIPYSFLDAYVP
jgi:tetratricopeptide (TPR) repeat protein